VDKLLVIII